LFSERRSGLAKQKISMKYYEMLCVLPGTMTEEEIKSSVEAVSQIVVKHNPENVTVEDMGKSRLAYPIKHIRYGYFQLFRFNLETEKINQLEKDVRLLDKMLRISIAICDPNDTIHYKLALDPTAPSAPPKPEREERGRARHRETERKIEEAPKVEVSTEVKEEVKPEEKIENTVVEEVKEVPKTAKKTTISVEEIDKKLDEILQDDMDKV